MRAFVIDINSSFMSLSKLALIFGVYTSNQQLLITLFIIPFITPTGMQLRNLRTHPDGDFVYHSRQGMSWIWLFDSRWCQRQAGFHPQLMFARKVHYIPPITNFDSRNCNFSPQAPRQIVSPPVAAPQELLTYLEYVRTWLGEIPSQT